MCTNIVGPLGMNPNDCRDLLKVLLVPVWDIIYGLIGNITTAIGQIRMKLGMDIDVLHSKSQTSFHNAAALRKNVNLLSHAVCNQLRHTTLS